MENKTMYDFALNRSNLELLNSLSLYANNIFRYFNGTINTINNNINLIIDTSISSDSPVLGMFVFPNNIYIYLYSIIYHNYFYGIETIKMKTLYTIIHELYHADQITDMQLYDNSIEYKNKIESEVHYMAYEFILNNSVELIKLFDIDMDFLSVVDNNGSEMYGADFVKYNRYDLFTYYSDILNEISSYNYSFSNVLHDNKNVICIVNGTQFTIQNNYKLNININEFNNLLLYKYTLGNVYNSEISIAIQDEIFIIRVEYIISRINPITII